MDGGWSRCARGIKVKLEHDGLCSHNPLIEGTLVTLDLSADKLEAIAAEMASIVTGWPGRGLERALNGSGVPTARGGTWTAAQVQRALERLERSA